jgi:signal transduction histidine kinase/ActR/RegA family two-component response regulator
VYAVGLVALALLYWAAAQLGFTLAFSVRQVSPVWPPAGIAVAALVRFGLRFWPGVTLGALVANLGTGAPAATAMGIAAGNTLEALAAAALLRVAGFQDTLERARDVLALGMAALFSSAIAASVGVASLAAAGLIPATESALATWVVWWVGDVVGVLTVAPLVLAPRAHPGPRRGGRLGEAIALCAMLALVGCFVFIRLSPAAGHASELEYLVFPILIWAALRFGARQVAMLVAAVTVLAIVGTVNDRGPFAIGSLTTRLVLLQLFVGVVAVTALALAALVNERRKAEAERDRLLGQERASRAESEVAYGEAQRANAAKDEFLAVLSHELRTPLTPILGWTRLLREADLDPDTRERALEAIDRNARVQVRLVEDLLDVSRIVAGKMTFEHRLVDLGAVADAAHDAVREAAEARSLLVQVAAPKTPALVWGDAERLQQAVVNLLANALKFTPKNGQIRITVHAEGDVHRLTVQDSGEGIAPAFLPRMFVPFTQSDTGTTRTHAGLGLGLAIVRHIVQHHGGSVSAASGGRGHGTTVTVTLPRAEPVASEAVPPAHPRLREARLAGVNILVVDDEPDARELLSMMLRAAGADVRTAPDVDGALQALARRPADILVSDLAMPGRDGLDLIRAVRAAASKTGPRAVLLTAYAGAEERRRAVAAGYDLHVAKPVPPDELVTLLADLARRGAPPAQS